MIPSIMCYVPPSVEFLGPTTPNFQTTTSPDFKPDWRVWFSQHRHKLF